MVFPSYSKRCATTRRPCIFPRNGARRASFGGLVAALVYEAMRAQVPDGRPPRSWRSPLSALRRMYPSALAVEVLREGKAVSQVLGRAGQDGQVVTIVQGSFGAGRDSRIAVQAEPAPQVSRSMNAKLPLYPNVTPEFTRHLAMRWAIGGMPFSGNHRGRWAGGYVCAIKPASRLPMKPTCWPWLMPGRLRCCRI